MEFQTPLIEARLIRRYKRFLADVTLPDGTQAVAHCPNPGAMTGLAEPGARIWLEPNDNPRKKLDYGWRLTELGAGPDTGFACIDTSLANRVVGEALAAGAIEGLGRYTGVRAEVAYGTGSRVDFLLAAKVPLYLEVKSVTLSRSPGLAEFPDTRTARGAKHMAELAAVVEDGGRAAVLYLVQRSDCTSVALAGDIDPRYLAAARAAAEAGVTVLARATKITPKAIHIGPALPVDM